MAGLNMQAMSTRDKLILAGLYLSKYDLAGVKRLGFDTFVEAFNVIGYALSSKPASVKNYRDEFDPLFPNARKGWHKREIRTFCLAIYKEFNSLDFDSFSSLIQSFFGYDENAFGEAAPSEDQDPKSAFAQRLATGLAAEHYFETVYSGLPEFQNYSAENTTKLGCGYDFRLVNGTAESSFLAVEVKGLLTVSGTIALTPKEHRTASKLSDRFYLFVVRNFRETPSHVLFRNPVCGPLSFSRNERVIVQTSWIARV